MSIFARQLLYVLERHEKKLGQLYNIHVEYNDYESKPISPGTITRLQRAVQGKHQGSVTLNSYELQAVQKAFSFEAEEVLRLRAALAAESLRCFLLGRIEPIKATLVGEALFQLLFDADDSAFVILRNRMVKTIRTDGADPDGGSTTDQDEESGLGPVVEIFESALLWIDTARITQNPILRQGYLAMVTSLLTSAQELIDHLPGSVSQRAEWRQAIDQAMLEVNDIREH